MTLCIDCMACAGWPCGGEEGFLGALPQDSLQDDRRRHLWRLSQDAPGNRGLPSLKKSHWESCPLNKLNNSVFYSVRVCRNTTPFFFLEQTVLVVRSILKNLAIWRHSASLQIDHVSYHMEGYGFLDHLSTENGSELDRSLQLGTAKLLRRFC